jgi:hypothetical protein
LCTITCTNSTALQLGLLVIISCGLFYACGMLDAEFGARTVSYGISLYLTPPLTAKQRMAGFYFLVCLLAAYFIRRKNSRIIRAGILVLAYGASFLMFQPIISTAIPCPHEPRLTFAEFKALHNCRAERYVDEAMALLESCPQHPAVSGATIDAFLSRLPLHGISLDNTARIQVAGPSPDIFFLCSACFLSI